LKRNFKREFEEEDVLQITEKIKIGVTSIGRGSGATFISTSLAKTLAGQKKKAVAFAELRRGSGRGFLTYDSLGMDRRFLSGDFLSFYSFVKERRYIRGCRNMDGGINWALMTPEENAEKLALSPLEEARLINNIYGDIVICDMGDDICRSRLDEMDIIICVVDPMPSKLIGSRRIYQKLKEEELKGRGLIWVVNKYNGGVNRKHFKDYVRIKDPVVIPLMRPEYFYSAEYNCRLPCEQKEIKEKIRRPMEEIAQKHILIT